MAFTFYFPSNGDHDDQDKFMDHVWNERIMDYLIYVRRISLRGNPYIKGVFLLNDDATPPSEFECAPLSNDNDIIPLASEFQEELSVENNGVELGSL